MAGKFGVLARVIILVLVGILAAALLLICGVYLIYAYVLWLLMAPVAAVIFLIIFIVLVVALGVWFYPYS